MKVAYRSSVSDALTDWSGTIAAGGAQQQLSPKNNDRCYFFLQNLSNADLWFTASNTPPANLPPNNGWIRLSAGADATEEGNFVTSEQFWIWGSTTGQAFTCKTGM